MTSPPSTWRGILLAGGEGLRAKPLTLAIPKPLLPLADKTVAETLLDLLSKAGVNKITVSLCHMAMHIEGYLRLARPELDLDFWRESRKLGTAGCLRPLSACAEHLLLVNADILTDLDFANFMEAHLAGQNAITILAVEHSLDIPYGLLEIAPDGQLRSWQEKPRNKFWVSGGVYAVTSTVASLIQEQEVLDMPVLVARAQQRGLRVAVHRHCGQWIDIGSLDAYERALKLLGNLGVDEPTRSTASQTLTLP